MRMVAGLGQVELGAPDHDLFAELQEGVEDGAQAHLLGAAPVQRQHVDAERGLQRGEAVELVQHHVGAGVALQLDHHAHAGAVALVAQVRHALDPLLAHQLGYALDHGGLVHLVGDLGDDDRLAVAPRGLHLRLAAHDDGAAAGHQGVARARAADDLAAGGEVRAGHDLQQRLERHLRIVDQGQAGVDHLAQVVRRDVGGHPHRDAAGAVDQDVGDARGQHRRLHVLAVVVRPEGDGVLLDVGEQRLGGAGHAALGVAHGGRRVVVHRAEVALAVDQQQPHGEGLRHPHQGVVDGHVAVRVVLADHVAHHAGGFLVAAARAEARLVHRVEDAAVHGLQTVAHVGQRAGDDHAHRVVEVAALQLRLDGDGRDAAGRRGAGGRCGGSVVGQGVSRGRRRGGRRAESAESQGGAAPP